MSVLPSVSRLRAWLRVRLRSRLQARRGKFTAGVGIALVTLLFAGLFILHQGPPAAPASAPAVACASNTSTVTMVPPGAMAPVKISEGEPSIVATVNGYPLCAEALELRVAGILANHRSQLQHLQTGPQHAPPSSLPPNLLATLQETPNQVRHDALTQMIQERLLIQEGKRLGLTVSLSAAQATARQVIERLRSIPASDPGRVSFEAYLRANHLTEQTFVTNPGILQGYVEALTIAAVRQHILTLPRINAGDSQANGLAR